MIDFTPEEEAMWASAMTPATSLTDGEYEGKLVKANFIFTNNGKKKLVLEYELLKPLSFQGKRYSQFLNLDTQNQMYYTQQTLVKLGVEAVALMAMQRAIEQQALGKVVIFNISTEGKYQNCSIISVAAPNTPKDDIPF